MGGARMSYAENTGGPPVPRGFAFSRTQCMQKSSATIGLALLGATLGSAGFDAYQAHQSTNSDFVDTWPDDTYSGATTRPWSSSSGWHSTHYYHPFGTSWSNDDFQHHSSSIGRTSSSSHSSTSRGGFGAHGHGGGS